MPLQASVISLLPPPSFSSASSVGPTSFIFDPNSKTLALMLSDSSVLLFPSFSLSSPFPPPPTRIPPVSTAASFLLLRNPNPNSANRTLFVSASPSPSPSSPSILLRAWTLNEPHSLFSPVSLSLNNRPSQSKTLTLDLRHGFGVRIAGSVNVLALFSSSSGRIWVFGPRAVGEMRVDLVKYSVIECVAPIYEMRVEKGVLALGEVGGVRVFPLRQLVKGRRAGKRNGTADGAEGGRAPGKLRTLKLRQNSGEFCSFFMMIKCAMVQDSDSNTGALSSVKAVSVNILSQKKFLVLDSSGDLYLLTLHNSAMASEATTLHSSITSKCIGLNHLDVAMKVQMLAVLPVMCESRQLVWLSDGSHSVHVLSVADSESPVRENDHDENKENSLQISAVQTIFTSEKVQDIVPLSASAILLLGQGKVFAYSIA